MELEPLQVRVKNSVMSQAIELVRKGGVIIYPTDTVYGIGCNPFNEQAVSRLRRIKRRNRGSMPVLVDKIETAEELGELNAQAKSLAEKFWPGPLTMVVPSKVRIPGITDENGLVGLRIPRHKIASRLIAGCEGKLVGTSANISGSAPASRVDAIQEELRSKVDMIIDGGESGQYSSTVVTILGKNITLTRIGEISKEEIIQTISDLKK